MNVKSNHDEAEAFLLHRNQAMAGIFLLAAFVSLYHDVILRLVSDWYVDENYSHGFLIIPIALYFVWERRRRLLLAQPAPSLAGLIVILGSLGVLLAGVLGSEFFLTRVSLLGTIAGAVLFILGRHHLRLLAFPILFLLLMIPLPTIIFNEIAFPLQLIAARFGEQVLMALSIPVLREGNIICLASTTLGVEEACSGIRSLITLLTLGIIYGYFMDRRIWVRFVLAASTIPIAIFANGLRVAGTGIVAHYRGIETALGFFHTFSGWLIFLIAFLSLFLLHRIILFFAAIPDSTDGTDPNLLKS